MNIFDLFPITAGEHNGVQNVINLLILICIMMASLTAFAYAVAKLISVILYAKGLIVKIPRQVKELRDSFDQNKKAQRYLEIRERVEMEERIRLQVRSELSGKEKT